jgi:hypothetical protein
MSKKLCCVEIRKKKVNSSINIFFLKRQKYIYIYIYPAQDKPGREKEMQNLQKQARPQKTVGTAQRQNQSPSLTTFPKTWSHINGTGPITAAKKG